MIIYVKGLAGPIKTEVLECPKSGLKYFTVDGYMSNSCCWVVCEGVHKNFYYDVIYLTSLPGRLAHEHLNIKEWGGGPFALLVQDILTGKQDTGLRPLEPGFLDILKKVYGLP